MKLLHFRRFGFLCFATSLALTSGCFDVGDDDDDDDDDSCETDDDCLGTRVCIDGECKRPGSGSGGSSGAGGSGNNAGKGGSGATGGSTGGSGATGGSTGGSGATGGSTGGTGSSTGGTGSSSGGSSGTGGTAPTSCTASDPIGCASSDEMILCTNGVPTVYSCSESCPQIGFEAVACVEGDGCCGDVIDPVCANGAIVYCTCSEMCLAEGDVIDVYVSCYQGDVNVEAFECIADYLDGDSVDCAGAEAACSGTVPAPEAP